MNLLLVAGFLVAFAASSLSHAPQFNVITTSRNHSSFLWVWLQPTDDYSRCVMPFTDIQDMVLKISANMTDRSKAILAGVGFGKDVYAQFCTRCKPMEYKTRTGVMGSLPATGGDLFFHAKSNYESHLYELNQLILSTLPEGCLDRYEDYYSFVYRGCRDFSGFIDGIENPKHPEKGFVAMDPSKGNSFVLTQRWVHDLDKIASLDRRTKESYIGRSLKTGHELKKKSTCSHVAKMTGSTAFDKTGKYRIYRQSQPYGSLQGPAGLFFIAFTNSSSNFDHLLDSMMGLDGSGEEDCLLQMTTCVSGNYWYFPGVWQLLGLKKYGFI